MVDQTEACPRRLRESGLATGKFQARALSAARVYDYFLGSDLEAEHRSGDPVVGHHDDEADRHRDGSVPDHPGTVRPPDSGGPSGLAVWPFISDAEGPYELMARHRDQVAPGGFTAGAKETTATAARSPDADRDPVTLRHREQGTEFLTRHGRALSPPSPASPERERT